MAQGCGLREAERRYRLRLKDEWIRVALAAEIKQSARVDKGDNTGKSRRARHLLSGLIKCAECGSDFTIASRDFYACAGRRERGLCTNTLKVRVAPLEEMVLSALQSELPPARARLFAEEFNRKSARLSRSDRTDDDCKGRLKEIMPSWRHCRRTCCRAWWFRPSLP